MFNGFYPNNSYSPYTPFQSGYNGQSSPMQAQQIQPPASNVGGFIPVQNENEARMYPIAPGTSATFIDENAPYCYTKTLGASQLDRPTFKRFRLVEEIDGTQNAVQGSQSAVKNEGIDLDAYALKADMDALAARIDELQDAYEKLSRKGDTGA